MSIIIPTWNGRHLLDRFLPSVIRAVETFQASGGSAEIIVVDDGSTDGTGPWLETHFSQVTMVHTGQNGGFGPACNYGFHHAQYPVILLLNNDVQVEPDLLALCVKHFTDISVFAVCSKSFELGTDRCIAAGKIGEFKRGFWRVYRDYDVASDQTRRDTMRSDRPSGEPCQYPSVLASGGFSAYSAEKLRRIGGFNPLLVPFYWEDVDLSLRAWKRGWKILYEPRAVVHHATSSTIGEHFHPHRIATISQRNRLITHWINLHDRTWMIQHLFVVTVLLLVSLLTFRRSFFKAFIGACRCMPQIRQLRREEQAAAVVSDRDLIRLSRPTSSTSEIQFL